MVYDRPDRQLIAEGKECHYDEGSAGHAQELAVRFERMLLEVEKLRLICEQAEGYADLIDDYTSRHALRSLLGHARENARSGDE